MAIVDRAPRTHAPPIDSPIHQSPDSPITIVYQSLYFVPSSAVPSNVV